MAASLNTRDLGRPIRVVVFGGAFFEPAALRFLVLLDEHPEIEFVGAISQSRGFGIGQRISDVVRRRKILAPAVLATYAGEALLRFLRSPAGDVRVRRSLRRLSARMAAVPDIHAPPVLERVRALRPDLGLIYGSPILRPELFEIPTFGTLGIHHGTLPEYRGKKTTFWAMYNGEATAGVAIQKINAGLDRGEVVSAGEVPIGRKRYGRIDAEVQGLGLKLYVDAVAAVKRGEAVARPQPAGSTRLYRQPSAIDILRLFARRLVPRAGG